LPKPINDKVLKIGCKTSTSRPASFTKICLNSGVQFTWYELFKTSLLSLKAGCSTFQCKL